MIRLFNRYWLLPAALSLAVEAGLLAGAVLAATRLRLGDPAFSAPHAGEASTLLRALIFALAGLLSLYVNGLYDFSEKLSARQVLIRLLRALTTVAVILWASYFLLPSIELGRGVFVLALAIGGFLLLLWRLFLGGTLRSERFAERILVVGTGPAAIDVAREILRRKHLGIRVVGFLDDDPALQGVSVLNPRVIGTTSQSCSLALENGVSRLVVAPGDSRGALDMDALLDCKTSGIRVQECSSYYEQITGKIMISGLRKSWLVFSDGFRVSTGVLAVKRASDLLIAGVGLVLAAPLMALIALAIRLDSPGPILFRQERVGRGMRPFTLWKFRSMRRDAEVGSGPTWAREGDPRVTRVGRLCRKSRLDELPQLWNVLVGDMSLVGPRPEREPFVRELLERCPLYEQRFVVRPGLTGWAQIKAPYASSFEDSIEKLAFDLYYIKNLSVFLDFSILLSTARTVLLGRGAR